MKLKWQILHDQMLSDIEQCRQGNVPETEQVEFQFNVALNVWEELKRQIRSEYFENNEEEIYFYKHIKPSFTSHIEFLILKYLSLLFSSNKTEKEIQCYWIEEEKRLSRFKQKNKEFINYYKGGSAAFDSLYFMVKREKSERSEERKWYDTEAGFITSHDYLVTSLLAHEMYHEYVKLQLAALISDTSI